MSQSMSERAGMNRSGRLAMSAMMTIAKSAGTFMKGDAKNELAEGN